MGKLFWAAAMAAYVVSRSVMADAAASIDAGDSAHKAFNDNMALDFYSAAVKEDAGSYEANWKTARTYLDIGDRATDKAKRKEMFFKGEEFAQAAMKLDPAGAQGYLQHGIALGRSALDTAAKEKIRLAKEIRTAFEKCISLDPKNDYGLHALGRWHREMATLSWLEKTFADMFLGGVPKDVSVERAAGYFRQAIAINPSHIAHHFELAKTLEILKKPREAIGEYEKALALPKGDADDDDYKATSRDRLKALRK